MTVYPQNSIAIVTRSGILKHTFPVAYIPFETTVNQDIKILSVAEDYVAGGAKMIASSRMEQLKRCREGNIGVPLLMIRVPMLSELDELVQVADCSLNSELVTLRALDKAAEVLLNIVEIYSK